MLPNLVDSGVDDLLLPPGIHQASLSDVEAHFVNTSPTYARRVEQWSLYTQFRTLIRGLVPVTHEFIDGSFVTSRAAPKDIDVSLWVEQEAIDALTPNQGAALAQIFADRMARYRCDAYLITPCEESHPVFPTFQYWKARTEESWPAYKNRRKLIVPGVVKGYVEVVS